MSKDTEKKIGIVTANLGRFLIEKNRNYGDSALNPANVFSKLDAGELLLCRADDKIKRIINSDKLRKNDCTDLCGYLILIMIYNEWYTMDDILE